MTTLIQIPAHQPLLLPADASVSLLQRTPTGIYMLIAERIEKIRRPTKHEEPALRERAARIREMVHYTERGIAKAASPAERDEAVALGERLIEALYTEPIVDALGRTRRLTDRLRFWVQEYFYQSMLFESDLDRRRADNVSSDFFGDSAPFTCLRWQYTVQSLREWQLRARKGERAS